MTNVSKLLDTLRKRFDIKSDSALARELGMTAPDISKLRSGMRLLSPRTILRIHERWNLTVKEIRDLAS
jgi:plasmid maintenance system antidote protein VapI